MDKPRASSIINVCVVPPEEVGQRCIDISQSLKSSATMFVLDGQNKFAHMTTYMARFADDRVADVVTAVEKALRGKTGFLCEHSGYFFTAGRYLEASYRKSDAFIALHQLLVGAVSGFRINPRNPYEEGYFTPYTDKQRKNAEETGYDLANDLYRPHITLTRYHEGKAPEVLPEIRLAKLSFVLHRVCVYKADDNGAVYKKLAEFTL